MIPKWCFRGDSNPRPQDGLELESSALDHSATKPTLLFGYFQQERSCGAMDSAPDFESGGWGFESLQDRFANQRSAIGLVVKYLVANEVPRVRFPDGAFLLSWRSWQRVGLIIPRSPVRPRSKAFLLYCSGDRLTKKFPNRELNPGLTGESRVS